MQERYGVEQLARMTDDELVQRQFAARNLSWLTVLLVLFTFARPALFLAAAAEGERMPDPTKVVVVTLFHALFLIVVALVRRKPRDPRVATGLVFFFIVAEYLVMHVPLDNDVWLSGFFLALLFSRFRFPERQIYTLHLSYFAVALFSAVLAPQRHAPATFAALAFVSAIIFLAMALQRTRTRSTRTQILAEWAEPLANAREQMRMRDELHYARELQLAMLPEAPPRLDWLDLAASSKPAAEVGGDYYDFYATDDRVVLVACDVAGHGMASGLVLASIRGGFTVLRRTIAGPAAALEQLHDLVSHSGRQRMLATAAVVTIDRATRRATIASAAHPPLVVRRNGSAEFIDLFAPPLGVRLPFTIAEHTCDLSPGDVLVLHSDGIYEARDAAGETYGLERLARVVGEHQGSAIELRDAILRDVETFRGTEPQEDDVTVVVAKLI
ncbi:MAG TPA: PP2C family protein-serine/threonine phosphatase [Thermoanaerobaculia bacterium]